MAKEFVERLSSNEQLKKSVHNVVKEGRLNMLVGSVSIAVGIFMFLKDYFTSPENTMDDLYSRVSKLRRTQIFSDMFSGVMLVYTGYSLVRQYVPSNNEISVAILVKYLNMKGVLEEDVMKVLGSLKPYRIKNLKIN